MITPQKLLLAESDVSLARPLRDFLSTRYSRVQVVFDLPSVAKELALGQTDFLLLDCDIDQEAQVLSLIRELNKTALPVLAFSRRQSIGERVRFLEAGADGLLTKPLDFRELQAHILSIWRRYLAPPPKSASREAVRQVEYPQLCINLTNYTVLCDGLPVEMPPRELELLYFLAASPNQVFTREQLLDHLWGYDFIGDARTVDVHIKRIRAKIKDHAAWSLDTVWGVGYKFNLHSTYISSDAPFAASDQTDSA